MTSGPVRVVGHQMIGNVLPVAALRYVFVSFKDCGIVPSDEVVMTKVGIIPQRPRVGRRLDIAVCQY